jgi:hypothetical protein
MVIVTYLAAHAIVSAKSSFKETVKAGIEGVQK